MGNVWEDHLIFKTLAGSHLYGTATPSSDVDERGVCHQTRESLIGLTPFEQYQSADDDVTIFGLVKFCALAAECNPNIIEILFAPTSGPTCLALTPAWQQLLDLRPAFITKQASRTFTGYATAQLQRIQRHYRWLREGPPPDPNPVDYGAIPAADTAINNNWKWAKLADKNQYQNAREKFRQYTTWLRERNPARRELEEQHGFDTKHALHLCRLMSQGQELLETGRITLPRPDAKWLLEIRNGLFTYDELLAWADSMSGAIQKAEAASGLPENADRPRIEATVMALNWAQLQATG